MWVVVFWQYTFHFFHWLVVFPGGNHVQWSLIPYVVLTSVARSSRMHLWTMPVPVVFDTPVKIYENFAVWTSYLVHFPKCTVTNFRQNVPQIFGVDIPFDVFEQFFFLGFRIILSAETEQLSEATQKRHFLVFFGTERKDQTSGL